MGWAVWHYDGQTASRQTVELVAEAGGFRLEGSGEPDRLYPWAGLESVGHRQGSDVYALKGVEGWRIGFAGGVPPELAKLLPTVRSYGGIIDKIGFWPASISFLAVSAAVVLTVVSAPAFLAPLIPMSWEKKLGDAMIGDFGGRICNAPGTDTAIAALKQRLDPNGTPVEIAVVNIDMVNAVALPGGRILLFKGLLKEASGPDEVAGVLGHEIGHVRNRDVAQALLRQFGLSVVLGGGNSGTVLNSLISFSYSREAEAKADAHAIQLLKQGRVSPNATADFFGKLAKQEKELGQGAAALGYLSSHPLSASREAEFRKHVQRGAGYSAAMSSAEWDALKTSCERDKDVEEGGDLLL